MGGSNFDPPRVGGSTSDPPRVSKSRISKIQQNAMKINGFSRFGRTRMDQDGRRPGGMRGAVLCLRQGSSGRDVLALCLYHGCARKGLAVFNRYAHSAGPKNHQKFDFWRFCNFWKIIKKLSFGGFGESLGTLGVRKNQFLTFLDIWKFSKILESWWTPKKYGTPGIFLSQIARRIFWR